MSDFDRTTHRECGHAREQEIPVDVPKEYHHLCFCCSHNDGFNSAGEPKFVLFDGPSEPEITDTEAELGG